MDSIRQCEDCRRIVPGEAGNACPFCGGGRLRRVDQGAVHVTRLHSPVFKLAIVFCFGLLGMQVTALALGFSAQPSGHGAPLWHLNLLVGVGVALYWILRRAEGDFRALFITTFGVFILSEALAGLARTYGIGGLRALSGVFRHALLVFSSLTLTAGAADGPGHSRHERVMLGAAGGFLFLSVLHLMLEFLKSENDRVEDVASAMVALAVAVYAGWTLWMERGRTSSEASAENILTPERKEPSSEQGAK